ncbi:MAG TPA: hypothetical protein V6D07_19115 [Trichocoleus sp.]
MTYQLDYSPEVVLDLNHDNKAKSICSLALINWVGPDDAIILNDALYWSTRKARFDGWFFRSQEEWTFKTGLKPDTVYRRLTKMVEQGWLESERRKNPIANSSKSTVNFYRVTQNFITEYTKYLRSDGWKALRVRFLNDTAECGNDTKPQNAGSMPNKTANCGNDPYQNRNLRDRPPSIPQNAGSMSPEPLQGEGFNPSQGSITQGHTHQGSSDVRELSGLDKPEGLQPTAPVAVAERTAPHLLTAQPLPEIIPSAAETFRFGQTRRFLHPTEMLELRFSQGCDRNVANPDYWAVLRTYWPELATSGALSPTLIWVGPNGNDFTEAVILGAEDYLKNQCSEAVKSTLVACQRWIGKRIKEKDWAALETALKLGTDILDRKEAAAAAAATATAFGHEKGEQAQAAPQESENFSGYPDIDTLREQLYQPTGSSGRPLYVLRRGAMMALNEMGVGNDVIRSMVEEDILTREDRVKPGLHYLSHTALLPAEEIASWLLEHCKEGNPLAEQAYRLLTYQEVPESAKPAIASPECERTEQTDLASNPVFALMQKMGMGGEADITELMVEVEVHQNRLGWSDEQIDNFFKKNSPEEYRGNWKEMLSYTALANVVDKLSAVNAPR